MIKGSAEIPVTFIEALKDAFLVSLPALLLCLLLDFVAGASLGLFFEKIMNDYPLIFVIIPGLMGVRGNIFGAMASRFTTMLYLGSMSPKFGDEKVKSNIFISVLLSLIPVFVLWLLGFLKIGDAMMAAEVLAVVFVSTVFATVVLGYSTALVTIVPFRKDVDPDAIASPLVTSIADLVTLPLLLIVILVYEKSVIMFAFLTILSLLLILFLWKVARIEAHERRIFREVLIILSVLAAVGSISGFSLEHYSEIIYASVIFTVMYPAILDSTGNFGCIVGAKTSTRIHLGEVRGFIPPKGVLLEILAYAMVAVIVGILANAIAIGMVKISLSAEVGFVPQFFALYPLLAVFVMLLSYFLAVAFSRAGLDPDNATIPTITTLADLASTLFTVAVAYLSLQG